MNRTPIVRERNLKAKFGLDGRVLCRCGDVARELIVKKENENKGRMFLVCAKNEANRTRCKLFLWADEIILSSVAQMKKHAAYRKKHDPKGDSEEEEEEMEVEEEEEEEEEEEVKAKGKGKAATTPKKRKAISDEELLGINEYQSSSGSNSKSEDENDFLNREASKLYGPERVLEVKSELEERQNNRNETWEGFKSNIIDGKMSGRDYMEKNSEGNFTLGRGIYVEPSSRVTRSRGSVKKEEAKEEEEEVVGPSTKKAKIVVEEENLPRNLTPPPPPAIPSSSGSKSFTSTVREGYTNPYTSPTPSFAPQLNFPSSPYQAFATGSSSLGTQSQPIFTNFSQATQSIQPTQFNQSQGSTSKLPTNFDEPPKDFESALIQIQQLKSDLIKLNKELEIYKKRDGINKTEIKVLKERIELLEDEVTLASER